MTTLQDCERLPGWELMGPGLVDARAGRHTLESCLVWIAAPRLRSAGILGAGGTEIAEPERKLYALLRERGGDAYPAYQSLLRRLARFEHALGRFGSQRRVETIDPKSAFI